MGGLDIIPALRSASLVRERRIRSLSSGKKTFALLVVDMGFFLYHIYSIHAHLGPLLAHIQEEADGGDPGSALAVFLDHAVTQAALKTLLPMVRQGVLAISWSPSLPVGSIHSFSP